MNDFLQQMLPTLATILGMVLTALAGYLITYINKKKKELQATTDNEVAKKYMDMIEKSITDSVLMVSQTYTEALKKQGAFTKVAQEKAFKMCLDNVLVLLNKEAFEYLNEITDDVTKYLTTKIEAKVKETK